MENVNFLNILLLNTQRITEILDVKIPTELARCYSIVGDAVILNQFFLDTIVGANIMYISSLTLKLRTALFNR